MGVVVDVDRDGRCVVDSNSRLLVERSERIKWNVRMDVLAAHSCYYLLVTVVRRSLLALVGSRNDDLVVVESRNKAEARTKDITHGLGAYT